MSKAPLVILTISVRYLTLTSLYQEDIFFQKFIKWHESRSFLFQGVGVKQIDEHVCRPVATIVPKAPLNPAQTPGGACKAKQAIAPPHWKMSQGRKDKTHPMHVGCPVPVSTNKNENVRRPIIPSMLIFMSIPLYYFGRKLNDYKQTNILIIVYEWWLNQL